MKKSLITFATIGVIFVLGIVSYNFLPNSSQPLSMMKSEEVVKPSDNKGKMMDEKVGDSRYVQYSRSVLDSASSYRRVLFFYASWCPTCKQAEGNFSQNLKKIPEGVTLIRVNYNDPETDQEEKELAKKYGITYQHTFVQIDSEGKEVTKWNGGQIEELLTNLK